MGEGVGIFSYRQEGLQPNTRYYVTAYAAVTANAVSAITPGLVTGSTEPFTTLPELPEVETADPEDILPTSAVVGGSILSDGGLPITEIGIFWSLDPDPVQNGTRLLIGDVSEEFTVMLQDLSPNKQYFYVAFATNGIGTALGEIKSFTTLKTLPTVITAIPSDITTNAAVLGGDVTSCGGAPITERGVYWGTSPDPFNDGTLYVEGSGQGEFSFLQEGLEPNTRYYVVAYAINSEGMVLGEIESFITDDILPDIFIPNAFMPESNHPENRVFMPTFSLLPLEYSLTIYNRWGQKLFFTENPAIGWDGRSDNNPAPHGGYSYIITYRYPAKKEHRDMGVFLLIR
jgi:gliding motility-associated-like protein